MELEETVREAIRGNASVIDTMGANPRVYLVQLPPNPTFPAGTLQRVSTQRLYSHSSGPGGAAGDFGAARFLFCFWDQSALNVARIARAVVAALKTFNAARQPASPVVLRQAPNFVLNQRMEVEPNTQPVLYKSMLDVKIWFQEEPL